MDKIPYALKKERFQLQRLTRKEPQEQSAKSVTETVESIRLDTSTPEKKRAKNSLVSGGNIDHRLFCLFNPESSVAEAFKLLRAKILCTKPGCRTQVIMVTSAQPADGKSIVAANLAISIAQGINEHVLLVDADLRGSSLEQFFGLHNQEGLSEYLHNGTSVGPYLLKTPVKKLTLLPAGKRPFNPSELLSSEKMRRLVEELKGRYHDRYIIVDTTPAGFAAETGFLATVVDGVLLIVRSGKTSKDQILNAVENIGRKNILGIVFNASDENKKKYDYYRSYYKKKQGK